MNESVTAGDTLHFKPSIYHVYRTFLSTFTVVVFHTAAPQLWSYLNMLNTKHNYSCTCMVRFKAREQHTTKLLKNGRTTFIPNNHSQHTFACTPLVTTWPTLHPLLVYVHSKNKCNNIQLINIFVTVRVFYNTCIYMKLFTVYQVWGTDNLQGSAKPMARWPRTTQTCRWAIRNDRRWPDGATTNLCIVNE